MRAARLTSPPMPLPTTSSPESCFCQLCRPRRELSQSSGRKRAGLSRGVRDIKNLLLSPTPRGVTRWVACRMGLSKLLKQRCQEALASRASSENSLGSALDSVASEQRSNMRSQKTTGNVGSRSSRTEVKWIGAFSKCLFLILRVLAVFEIVTLPHLRWTAGREQSSL